MPLTISHAVVAVPFARTPLVPAAIAIGAMTPDLPLFVRGVGLSYASTHAIATVGWTALLACGLFLVWRVLLRPLAVELAPSAIARRLPEAWSTTPTPAVREALGIGGRRGYPLFLAASLVLGVLSHIVWDAFTHEGRWGVDLLPVLDEMWGPLPGYKWSQHVSGLGGVVVLAMFGVIWLRRRPEGQPVSTTLPTALRFAAWAALPIMLLASWGIGWVVYGGFSADFTAQHLAYRVLPPSCALWAGAMVVLSIVLAVIRSRPSSPARAV